ncbi:CTD nuclear envelope phosphatase 1 homolog [Drosophila montana]|uniref:CTD nuclear envelope phosphatase 1 homolog n=1 Tax=Drosophila montana TaxID=40370 RepID=UPI00313CBA8D
MENQDNFLLSNFYFLGTLGMLLTVIILAVPVLRHKLRILLAKFHCKSINYTPITYLKDDILNHVSRRRLRLVRRKTLILDMDETLIASVILYQAKASESVPASCDYRARKYKAKSILVATLPYDFSFYLPLSGASVYVYKRPHVDFFLDRVSKWYNLVVFTAATEMYASRVLDFLDAGRNILTRRMYRQDCINICGIRAKFVSIAHSDLSNVLLLDDCHMENSFNVGNAVHIKSYRIGSKDDELLRMLPFLDALRFTQDVRSILGRCTRYDCLTTCLATHYCLAKAAESEAEDVKCL